MSHYPSKKTPDEIMEELIEQNLRADKVRRKKRKNKALGIKEPEPPTPVAAEVRPFTFKEIFEAANEAALAVVTTKVRTGKKVKEVGGAYIILEERRDPFAKWVKRHNLGMLGSRSRVCIIHPGGYIGNSLEISMAGAKAFSSVLKIYGISHSVEEHRRLMITM